MSRYKKKTPARKPTPPPAAEAAPPPAEPPPNAPAPDQTKPEVTGSLPIPPAQTMKEKIAEREKRLLTRKCAACGERCAERCHCKGCDKTYCDACRVNPHDLSRFKHPAEDHLSPYAVPRADPEPEE